MDAYGPQNMGWCHKERITKMDWLRVERMRVK